MGKKDKNNSALSFIELEMGKMPPQAVELEEAILGAILLEKDCLEEYFRYLHAELFYRDAHKLIFTVIADLFNANKEVDSLTVVQELKQREKLEEVGGYYYIAKLTDKVASSANIGTHIEYIIECFIRRECIRLGSETIESSYNNPNPYETISTVEVALDKINRFLIGNEYENSKDEEIEAAYESAIKPHTGELTGVDTGIKVLNEETSGWQPSDLIILAGRASMGKTALALKLAKSAKIPVAIFSLEMAKKQLIDRQLIEESGISNASRKTSWTEYELQKFAEAKEILKKQKIYINDKSDITPRYLNAWVRSLNKKLAMLDHYERSAEANRKEQQQIGLIIIDYLQLMSSNKEQGNREQEIASISRALKKIAKDLNIPIIALSQLSRDVEKRTGKHRPQLSDLRESGAIEQDADMVIFTYRPNYYYAAKNFDPDYKHGDLTQEQYEDIMEIIIAKHRNGPIFRLRQYFYKNTGRFEETTTEKEEVIPEQIDLPF